MTKKLVIICIGAGGTGGYFAKEYSRYYGSKSWAERRDLKIEVESHHIVDGDVFETKNMSRQTCQHGDEGMNKAVTLAGAFGDVFDVDWIAHTDFITKVDDLKTIFGLDRSSQWVERIPMIIGCVDNHACRKVCEDFFNDEEIKNCIYIDSANEFSSGQVVFSVKSDGKVVAPCRSWYFPGIFNDDMKAVTEMSCTELNSVSPQHIATNMLAGMQILSAVCSFLESGQIKMGISFFDANELSMAFLPPSKFRPVEKRYDDRESVREKRCG